MSNLWDLETVADTVRSYAWIARTALTRRKAANPTGRRHLLLLAWLFPPKISGGIYRPAALARYAAERGWRVTVVCAPEPPESTAAGRYMLEYVGNGARIVRMQPPTLRPSWKLFPRVDGGFLDALQTFDVALSATSDSMPGVIVATGPPFHNFVAARYLGRSTGIPYVLDYRDEWTECPFSFVKRGNADRRYERACLRHASRVVFTTASQLEHQAAAFGELERSKCSVIPNGWEPNDLAAPTSDMALAPATFRLAFVGTLGDHTLPATFLATMEALIGRDARLRRELRLTFVGQKSPRAREHLAAFPCQEVIEQIDQVSKPDALHVMRTADALLVINDEALHRYVPGKVYEYLAMETPILVYGSGGEVADLVRRFEAGCVVTAGDAAGLERALRSLPRLRGASLKKGVKEWLSEQTRKELSFRFVDLLEDVIEDGMVNSRQAEPRALDMA